MKGHSDWVNAVGFSPDGKINRDSSIVFFFQAEDGIRDLTVTGVQTCALPILTRAELERSEFKGMLGLGDRLATAQVAALVKRGLLVTDSPHGKLRFGVPQHEIGRASCRERV